MEDIYKLKPEQFPKPLLEIPQPPKTLYIRGKLPDPNMVYLAVVGSRKYTSYGKNICEKLKPAVSDGGSSENRKSALIYATDHPDYAIFLAIINLKDGGRARVRFDEDTKLIKLSINIQFVNGQSQIKPGYIHVLDGQYFTKQSNQEFTSEMELKPLLWIPVEASDLGAEILVSKS